MNTKEISHTAPSSKNEDTKTMLINVAFVIGFEQVLYYRDRGNGTSTRIQQKHDQTEQKIWFNKFYCSFNIFSYVNFKTSTYRRQKFRSIYSKFSLEWSELAPSFQNPQEVV